MSAYQVRVRADLHVWMQNHTHERDSSFLFPKLPLLRWEYGPLHWVGPCVFLKVVGPGGVGLGCVCVGLWKIVITIVTSPIKNQNWQERELMRERERDLFNGFDWWHLSATITYIHGANPNYDFLFLPFSIFCAFDLALNLYIYIFFCSE